MKRKSIISFMLMFILALQSFVLCAFAQPVNNDAILFEKSEYELLKEMEKTGDIKEDYRKLMKDHIYELKENSIDTLQSMGYSAEQIKAIKNFDGSEKMMALAASTVKFTINIESYTYNKSKDMSEAKVKIKYEWTGEPAFKGKDILGFVWSDNFDLDTNRSYLRVNYKNSHYPNTTKQVRYDFETVGLTMGQVVFPLHETKGTGSDLIGLTGLSGTGYIYLTKMEEVKVFKIYGSYGHSLIKITSPSISVSGSGISGGVTFKGQVDTIAKGEDSARITKS